MKLSMKTIQIPIDNKGKPLITTEMKMKWLGEFSFKVPEYCFECDAENANSDCPICGGKGEYLREITIPWTVCKEIYKTLAISAALTPNETGNPTPVLKGKSE